jgi:hypothetical protein
MGDRDCCRCNLSVAQHLLPLRDVMCAASAGPHLAQAAGVQVSHEVGLCEVPALWAGLGGTARGGWQLVALLQTQHPTQPQVSHSQSKGVCVCT